MQLGNGRWESTTFNNRLQPTQIALGRTLGATDLLKLDYQYGDLDWDGSVIAGSNNGNVAKQTITVAAVGATPGFTAVQNYDYDALNRIQIASETLTPTTGTAESWVQEFKYDRYGNRNFNEATATTLPKNCGTSPNFTVCTADVPKVNPSIDPSNNRLNSTGYTFDSAGNTTKDAENRKFTYDAENKQVKVETVDGSNNVTGAVGEYVYDGDGKRIKKRAYTDNVLTEETIFVYDASGALIAEYSNQVASLQDAQVAYLTSDHLGSPRINTDINGNVSARHDYHPFGEEIASSKRVAVLGYSGDSIRKQFTGYERDNETDLDFANARMYSHVTGRFLTPDPVLSSATLKNPQSWSRYTYCVNNALNLADPTGMWVWGKGFGAGKSDEELTDKEKNKRKEFRDALETARLVAGILSLSDNVVDQLRSEEITRALDAYGDEGKDNGVTLKIGEVSKGADAEANYGNPFGVRADGENNLVPDVVVTFKEGNTIDAIDVGHEGSHVADRAELAYVSINNLNMSTEDWIRSPQNISRYNTEHRAYWIGSYIAESLGQNRNANGTEYWNAGWTNSEKETKRANGIEKVLERNYNVTSQNRGDNIVKAKPAPVR